MIKDIWKKKIDVWGKCNSIEYCPNCLEHPTALERWVNLDGHSKQKFKCDCGLIDNIDKLLKREEMLNRKRTELIERMLK